MILSKSSLYHSNLEGHIRGATNSVQLPMSWNVYTFKAYILVRWWTRSYLMHTANRIRLLQNKNHHVMSSETTVILFKDSGLEIKQGILLRGLDMFHLQFSQGALSGNKHNDIYISHHREGWVWLSALLCLTEPFEC